MIDTFSIRCSILHLAFSGKLTEQHESDGTAFELISMVNPSKTIIYDGKTPYDLPPSWAWVRLADLYSINPKIEADSSVDAAFIPMDKISAGFDDRFSFETQKWGVASKNHTRFADGDVAFAKISPCFENRKSFIAHGLPNGIGGGTTELIILRQKLVLPRYTYYLILDQRFIHAGSASYHGIVGQQRVQSDVIKNYLVPVAPYSEQKRIVEKIEQAFSILDTIDTLQGQYADDLTVLKSKLIDAAIQGKLTEQLPEDGTAEELYQQIQAEKQALIKAGKIKKEKPLPEITLEEIPFEIPANWKWANLSSITKKITDGTHHSPVNSDAGEYMYVTAKNVKEKGVSLDNITFVSETVHNEIYSRCDPELNDVLLIKDGATTGIVTVNNLREPFSMLSSVALIKPMPQIDPWYIVYAMRSSSFYKYIRSEMTGVGITRVVLRQIQSFTLPLPPLKEQKRIVARLNELLIAIDK